MEIFYKKIALDNLWAFSVIWTSERLIRTHRKTDFEPEGGKLTIWPQAVRTTQIDSCWHARESSRHRFYQFWGKQ